MAKMGGARQGAGRKSKLEEEKVKTYSLAAMKKVFGSEEEAWESLATQAKKSFKHMQLLFEYSYGKPKEKLDVTTDGEQITRAVIEFRNARGENTSS